LIPFRTPAAFLITIFSCLPALAQQHTVAITFDDLPIAATDTPATERMSPSGVKSINRAILISLERHRVPSTGFVNEKRIQSIGDKEGKEILWEWVKSGHDLGNHGYSHSDFNQLTIEQMEEEIVSGERSLAEILRKSGRTPRYFRFPFNHTGDTAAKHDAVASFLENRGYKLAPCTMENEDYVFDRAYLQMLTKKDPVTAERLRSEYLAYTATEIDYYSGLNNQVFGYEPPHIMLLHVNRLNADMVDAVLSLFEKRRYKFVTLDEAEGDRAFTTSEFVTPDGWMWGIAGQRNSTTRQRKPRNGALRVGSRICQTMKQRIHRTF
jgi:peptidoglycan/xylan/chitin deacetylase (PgdA/CDA1 family)